MGPAQARCFDGGSSFPGRSVSICWHCWTGVSHLLITFHLKKHLSQHRFCLLRGNLSPECFRSPETLGQITARTLVRISVSWAPPQTYVDSSQPSSPLLPYFACLTGYLHAVASVSLCLPVIALVIMTNTRRALLAPLYLVSSCCCCDWAEPTDKFLRSARWKFRLSHKQLCLHCGLFWLCHHSTLHVSQEERCGMLPHASWPAGAVHGPQSQTQTEFFYTWNTLFGLHHARCPHTYVPHFDLQ